MDGVYCYTQLWKMEPITIEKACFEMMNAKGKTLAGSFSYLSRAPLEISLRECGGLEK